MNMRRSWGLFLGGVAVCIAGWAQAVPQSIRYTGELLGANGLPYSGEVQVKAALFSAASGGTALWESATWMADVSKGVLEAALSAPALAGLLYDHDALWLEFTIEGETLAPRQMLTSVPYATIAGNAQMLGGLAPEDFMQAGDVVAPSALPTNGIAEVSNGAMSNQFAGVSWSWGGPAASIPDAPDGAAQANVTTSETGNSYLTDLAISTTFTLSFTNHIEMILYPPPAAGVGPITLINGMMGAGTHQATWTPGNVPALAGLMQKKVAGQWSLTVQDKDDNAAPGVNVGQLAQFVVDYDVVRSDHMELSGKLDIEGSLKVTGGVEVGGALHSDFIGWQGYCSQHGGSVDFITYCLDSTSFNRAAGHLVVDANAGTVTVLYPGIYRVSWYTWNRNNCGSRHDARILVNNNPVYAKEDRNATNYESLATMETTLLLSANDVVLVQARSNCSSTEPWRSYHQGPLYSRFTMQYLGD